MLEKYVIFDRDGTLIDHVHHLTDPALVVLKTDLISSFKILQSNGFKFGIVTNQSVVGRGLANIDAVQEINAKITRHLTQVGISIDFIAMCLHAPEDGCECRKPKPHLGLVAAEQFGINLSESYMVGDQESDLLFGLRLGCKVIQIQGNARKSELPNYYSDTLSSAAKWIVNDSAKMGGAIELD